MPNNNDYTALTETLMAIPDFDVHTPDVPVFIAIQEAKLCHSTIKNREALFDAGLAPETIEALKVSSGALKYAEEQYCKISLLCTETKSQWNTELHSAYNLRNSLLHDFMFAYPKNKYAVVLIREMMERTGDAEMMQDLVNLNTFGQKYPKELEKIEFDFSLLKNAITTVKRMSDLLKTLCINSAEENKARNIRDRAYTYLKTVMNKVQKYKKCIPYHNEKRNRDYTDNYIQYSEKTSSNEDADISEKEFALF